MYMGHSEWCVWNGHLPDCYYNGWREIRNVWEQPHMPEIAQVLKSGGANFTPVEPEMPIPAYDEPWITNTVRPAVVQKYTDHGVPLDDQYPVWITRTQYDYNAGTHTQEASLEKHLAELDAELATRPT